MPRTIRRSWFLRPRALFEAIRDLAAWGSGRRGKKSANPDPVRLVLDQLERRELASESLSIIVGGMFVTKRDLTPLPPARTAGERAGSDTADSGKAARAFDGTSIALPSAREEPARPRADQAAFGPAPGGPKLTAWADPWGRFGDEFDDASVSLPPRQGGRPADDDAPRGGGGGASPDGLAGRTGRPAEVGAPGRMPTTPADPEAVPAQEPTKSASVPPPAPHADAMAKGGGGSESPFPWAARSSGIPMSLDVVTYGSGTTVFTPATLTHPEYVVDANKGAVLTESVINHDFSEWDVDLRAQVSDATVGTYTWDFYYADEATSISALDEYSVQFTWDSFTGDPRDEMVSLTTDFVGGGSNYQEFHFLVAGTDSPAWSTAPTDVATWPTVVTPDMVRADAPTADGVHHTATLADGTITTWIDLPVYNPAVAPLGLVYNSGAADARPIFVTRYELAPGHAVPSSLDARLTVDGTPLATYTYDTSLMNPGDFVQVSLQKDATGLSTGRHTYSVVVKPDYTTAATYSGSFTLVNDAASPYGAGWWVGGLDRIVTGTGGVALVMAGGRSLWFADAGGGAYTSPAGEFSSLVQNGGGDWTLTLADRTVQQFESGGKLTSVADANGNTTTYTYTSGRLYTVTDPYNQVTTFAYDGSSKLDYVIDPAGRTTQITVASGKLTAATDPAGGAWAYGYDGSGRLTTLTDPDDWVTTIAYDSAANRADTITEADGATESVHPVQVQGLSTGGTPTAILTAAVTADFVDGNSHTWARRLDWLGLGRNMQLTDPITPNPDVSVQYRDADGLLWLDSDGLGRRDRYAYDANGNVTRATWADDAHDDYVYDTGTNPFGDLVSHSNPIGETTTFSYDADSNLLTVTNPLEETTTLAYDGRGHVVSTTTPLPSPEGWAERAVNTTTTGDQLVPAVASDADGDTVVVWASADASGYGIFARRFGPDGAPVGGEIAVNTTTGGDQVSPAVAVAPDGSFVVVWETPDGWNNGIAGRRFHPDGSYIDQYEFPVSTTTYGPQWEPQVGYAADGSFVVAWDDPYAGNTAAQLFAANGSAVGSEFALNDTPTNWHLNTRLSVAPDGTFVAGWVDVDVTNHTYEDAVVRTFAADGTPTSSEHQVLHRTTYPFQILAWDVSRGIDGSVLATYDVDDGSGFGVKGVVRDPGGSWGSEHTIPAFTYGNQEYQSTAPLPGGGWAVAWWDETADGDGLGVFTRLVAADGTPYGDDLQLNVETAGDQYQVKLSSAPGGIAATWTSDGQDGDGLGVYTRRYLFAAETRFDYDDRSRLSRMINAEGGVREFGYDAAGNVETDTDERGFTTTSTYDDMGRELTRTLADDDGNPVNNPVWDYGYDGLGQLTSQTDPLGRATMLSYDPRGNLFRESTPMDFTSYGEGQANDVTAGDQQNPAVAVDADGDYVVVWQSDGNDGDGFGIYAQLYNSYGVPQSEFPIAVNYLWTGNQTNPSVAMDADGAFVVAWQDEFQDGDGSGIFARRFDRTGAFIDPTEFVVNTLVAGDQINPAVAMDADGDFVVAWDDPSYLAVSAQQYYASGSAHGSAFDVPGTPNTQDRPAVAMDADGDFVIAWSDYSPYVYSDQEIAVQRYHAAGGTNGGTIQANTFTTGYQANPAVAMDADGDFVVAWQSDLQDGFTYYSYGYSTGDGAIVARRFNAAGSPQGAEIPVNTHTTSTQSNPAVAMDSGGNFVVAWQSAGQDGSGNGVYGQRFAADGTARDDEFGLNTFTGSDQMAPSIGSDAEGNFVGAWNSDGQDGSGQGVESNRNRDTAERRWQHNPGGDLFNFTDPNGAITSMTYDDAGRPTSKTDPLGRVVLYGYDAASQLVAISDVAIKAPQDLVTTISYMPRGQVDVISYPSGAVVDYAYCTCGCENGKSVTDNLGNTVTTAIVLDDASRPSTVTVDGKTTTIAYDVAGNVASVTDPNNLTTDYKYDALGRMTATTNALSHTMELKYDAAGNLIATTDALDHTTTLSYDAQGRAVTSRDALDGVTTIAYDLAGQVRAVTDPDDFTTTYAYDRAGNRAVTTDPRGNDTVAKFDAANQLVRLTDRDNRVRAFTYDDAGQMTNEIWLDGGGTPVYTATYDYGDQGQYLSAVDDNSVYHFGYDDDTGLLETIDTIGTPVMPQVTLTYEMSGLGVPLSVQDDQGGRVDYAYDGALRLTNAGLSVSSTPGAQVSMVYDDGGRLRELHRQNGLSGDTIDSAFDYNDANRLTEIDHVSSQAGTLSVLTYAYDNANRLTGYTGIEGSREYAYDDTDQLMTVTNTSGPTVLESFTYDANGNRTSANGVSYGGVDPGNRLTSDGEYDYDYDDEGNTTVKTKTGERWEYTYDYRNRLTEVTELTGPGGTVLYDAQYTYDVFDRRIGVYENGSQVLWTLYDGANAYADFDGGGTMTMRYLNGLGMDERYARQDAGNGDVAWYLTDNLGSTRQLAQTDGTVLATIAYDAFGTPHASGSPDRFQFTGREYDAGAGQYYYRARYYAPDVGRFRSQDPLGFAPGDENIYRYVTNSPLSRVDPLGLGPANIDQAIRGIREAIKDVDDHIRAELMRKPPDLGRISQLKAQREELERHLTILREINRIFDPSKRAEAYERYLRFLELYIRLMGLLASLSGIDPTKPRDRDDNIAIGTVDAINDLIRRIRPTNPGKPNPPGVAPSDTTGPIPC